MPRTPPTDQVMPGFRPDLVPENVTDPPRGQKSLEETKHEENEETEFEDIIKTMQLNFLDKVRIKLMSPEEKEAFIIEKAEAEKKKRQVEKQRPCHCQNARKEAISSYEERVLREMSESQIVNSKIKQK